MEKVLKIKRKKYFLEIFRVVRNKKRKNKIHIQK